MSQPPPHPAIYHITHLDNLPAIVTAGGLWSDAHVLARGGTTAPIGMSKIKMRRLDLPVWGHPPTTVGQYVPFYFCPRSVMLYIIHQSNHPELAYRGGQAPIVHLEADLHEVVAWLDEQPQKWAFTLSNAGARYAEFRTSVAQLDEVNWTAVFATDFRDPIVKEGKQAEFLVHQFFPWSLVRRIGVYSASIGQQVLHRLSNSPARPIVEVRREWYY